MFVRCHFRIGQLSSVQSVRFFARKQKVKKTLDDLFQETSEMITEKFMKKFNTTVQQVEPKPIAFTGELPKLKIFKYPDDVAQLRAKSLPVTKFDESLKELANDMLQSMYASKAIGLSAPQVGTLKRMLVLNEISDRENKAEELIIINPEILSSSDKQLVMEEGCLSFPEIYGIVNRSASIKVRFNDITGAEHTAVFSGKKAAIILHEIDHFNGVLLIDRMKRGTKD